MFSVFNAELGSTADTCSAFVHGASPFSAFHLVPQWIQVYASSPSTCEARVGVRIRFYGQGLRLSLCGSGARVFLVRRLLADTALGHGFACLSVVLVLVCLVLWRFLSCCTFLVVDAPVQCCRAPAVAIPQVQFFVLLMTCLSLHNDRCRVRQCRKRAGAAVAFEVVSRRGAEAGSMVQTVV